MPSDPDSDDHDVVDLQCAECGEVREHVVLRAAAAAWTLQCQRCKTTRTMPAPKQPRPRVLPVI